MPRSHTRPRSGLSIHHVRQHPHKQHLIARPAPSRLPLPSSSRLADRFIRFILLLVDPEQRYSLATRSSSLRASSFLCHPSCASLAERPHTQKKPAWLSCFATASDLRLSPPRLPTTLRLTSARPRPLRTSASSSARTWRFLQPFSLWRTSRPAIRAYHPPKTNSSCLSPF